MDVMSLIALLWRHKLIIVLTTLLALVGGVGLIKMSAPIYEASALILMDPDKSFDDKRPADGYANAVRQSQYLNTQVQIAQSESVLAEVAERMVSTAEPAGDYSTDRMLSALVSKFELLIGRGEARKTADLAASADESSVRLRNLRQALKVEVEINTDIMKIKVRDRDPARAQDLANQIATRFIERRAALYSNPQAVNFFAEQEVASRKRLTEVEAKFRAFSLQTGIFSLDDQKKLLLERRDKASADLAHTLNAIQRVSSERDAYRAQLASLRAKIYLPEEIFGPNTFNPMVRPGLSEQSRMSYDPPLLHVRLYQDSAQKLVNLNAELSGLKGMEAARAKDIDDLDKTLLNLIKQRSEFIGLSRQVEEAQQSIALYARRGTETRIENAWRMNQGLSNMQVIEQASRPILPVYPRPALILPLATLLGAVLGIGLAFAIDAITEAGQRGGHSRRAGGPEPILEGA